VREQQGKRNMLTGRLYLSNDLGGGVFDEASRSLDERRRERITADLRLLSMVCAWR
jgi:hypothetical protein